MTVTADATTLMRQASATANEYLMRAVEDIDSALGSGYARNHPELICAFMRTAAQDFHTALLVQAIEQAADQIRLS